MKELKIGLNEVKTSELLNLKIICSKNSFPLNSPIIIKYHNKDIILGNRNMVFNVDSTEIYYIGIIENLRKLYTDYFQDFLEYGLKNLNKFRIVRDKD